MKQRATESTDCFAYRFKNNLHQLSKLGEAIESNSPHFIMSQFISKTKTDIQKHLVLKAEEYTEDLSEIIEAAKRIERSFKAGLNLKFCKKIPSYVFRGIRILRY